MKPLHWHIGDVIRKIRDTDGLSQKDVAPRAGISRSALVRFEQTGGAQSKHATVEKIARAVGCPLREVQAAIPISRPVGRPSIDELLLEAEAPDAVWRLAHDAARRLLEDWRAKKAGRGVPNRSSAR